MTDYRLAGTHQINKWLWSKLQTFQYFDFEKQLAVDAFGAYGVGKIALVPIIPAQQVPEFTNIAAGAPFIVYGYSVQAGLDQWYLTTERGVYTIYDNDEDRLRSIHHYMFDLLRRADQTANEVNDFMGTSSFNFKFISAPSATSPTPFRQEGGRQAATIATYCEYTTDLTSSTGLRS